MTPEDYIGRQKQPSSPLGLPQAGNDIQYAPLSRFPEARGAVRKNHRKEVLPLFDSCISMTRDMYKRKYLLVKIALLLI
jgi:hypothetical protein